MSQATISDLGEDKRLIHVSKFDYLLKILRRNPSELLRLLHIALTTAKYRYIKRCIGKGCIVGRWTQIVNSANVQIGDYCLFQDGVYIRAGNQGKIIIGDQAALNSFSKLFGHGTIEIGEETQIGPGSLVTTTDHDYLDENLETRYKKVVIGKRVWIGANVTILPGVTIGDHAVIGAGAVVTKDVPPRSVAVGVPARVIKQI